MGVKERLIFGQVKMNTYSHKRITTTRLSQECHRQRMRLQGQVTHNTFPVERFNVSKGKLERICRAVNIGLMNRPQKQPV